MNKVIYVSHSIRGKLGDNATLESMAENNRKAIEFGAWLKASFPAYKFYVPGALDSFLVLAGINPAKIVEPLMNLDFAVIDLSIGMIVFMPDDYTSNGIRREIYHCVATGKPHSIVGSYGLQNPCLKQRVKEWLEIVT